MLGALFDDKPDLHVQVRGVARLCLAQTTLIELLADSAADALLGEIALDSWIIRAVLQARLLPIPAAIASVVSLRVKITLHLGALAGVQQQ